MKFFLVSLAIILLAETGTVAQGTGCSSVDICSNPLQVCKNSKCNQCSWNSDCSSWHDVRKSCIKFGNNGKYCVQCTKNNECGGGMSCVTSNSIFLCATKCTSPTDTCASGQCIYVRSGRNSGGYYCLTCENDSDCRKWSSNSLSTCNSGICDPPFTSCRYYSDCPDPDAAHCKDNVCQPCSENSDCAHLPDTPKCDSGKCVECKDGSHCSSGICISNSCAECNDTYDCRNPVVPVCSSNTCVPCTDDIDCTHIINPLLKPFCNDTGACVECESNADCAGKSGSRCSEYGVCSICLNSTECTTGPDSYCHTALGKCTECELHEHCQDHSNSQCSSEGSCEPCKNKYHCAHFDDTKACKTISPGSTGGICVECASDEDCPTETDSECSSSSNTCVPCTDSDHCKHIPSKPVCKTTEPPSVCVECESHDDCTSPMKSQCLGNVCISCTDSSHCEHLDDTPVCNTTESGTGGVCVACNSNSDCQSPEESECGSDNTCGPCTSSDSCAHFTDTRACDTFNGICVECSEDSDCTSTKKSQCSVDNHTCIPCDDSSQCEHLLGTTICSFPGPTGFCTPACVPNCLECLNSAACKICLPGFYLLNTTACLTVCPIGYWKNELTKTCNMCNSTCQTCDLNTNNCTSCFTPYILDGSKCYSPPGIVPPTVTLKSSSDPQTFLLVFSNPMAVTNETLSQTLQFSLTGMTFPTDYYLLNVIKQPDSKTFRIIFNFTKSIGIETLTATFTNTKVVIDENGLIVTKDSVSAQTVRFTFLTMGEKAAAESLTSVGSSVSNAALSSSVGMFLAGGAGGMLWAFLGLFQIVNYLLFLNVNYPYHVVTFFQLFSMSSLNGVVPNPMEILFPSIWEEMEAGLPSPPKFADNEMDALYLNNAGQTIVAWVAVGMLYLLAKVILFVFRTTGRFSRIITTFKEKFEWGIVYNAFIGTYPELIIASCLQLANMDFTTPLKRFSSIAALIVGGLCFWAPFAVTYALESSKEVLGTELHEKRHGALYEPFIVDSNESQSPERAYYRRNFMAFIFLRKIAYFSAIVFAYDIPILQMTITCGSGIVLLVFMIKIKPYRNKTDAWMNIGSEVFMIIIHLVIFVFAGDDITLKLTDDQRKSVGWAVIVLCCTMVAYMTFFIFVQQVLALWSFGKMVVRAVCKKKKNAQVKPSGKADKPKLESIPENAAENQEELDNSIAKPLDDFSKSDLINFIQDQNPIDSSKSIPEEPVPRLKLVKKVRATQPIF